MIITQENLRAVRTLITHADCHDGIASALIVKDVLSHVITRFVHRGTAEYKRIKPEPGLLFIDLVPPAERAAEFVAHGTLVLDHHKTDRDIVELLGGIFGDEATQPGVCGAVLAFKHVWKTFQTRPNYSPWLERRVEEFATLVGLFDTWQRKDSRWQDARWQASILRFQSPDRWLEEGLKNILGGWDQKYQWLGPVLEEKEAHRARRTIDSAYRFTTRGGTRVVVFEGRSQTSDVVDLLGNRVDLVIGFSHRIERDRAKTLFSMRSHSHVDCGAFAKRRGGAGHTSAAGFVAETPNRLNIYEFVQEMVEGDEG